MKLKGLAVAVFLVAACALGQRDDIPAASVMQPEELVRIMQSGTNQKPIVLYVGPRMMYAQGHVAGAEYIGPVGRPDGMQNLRARAKTLSHDAFVVIYCGCCPYDHCPNIQPAYQELQKSGFSKVRVLYLATSFGANWADKGYPVIKGE